MTGQDTAAAERSAHVLRGAEPEAGQRLTVVEVSPGVWRLRALVEAEAEVARLIADRDRLRAVLAETGEALDEALAQVDAAQEMAAELRERVAQLEASRGATAGGLVNAGLIVRVLPGCDAAHYRDMAAELLRRAEGGR